MPYLPPVVQVTELTSYWRAVPAGGPVPHDDPSYFDFKMNDLGGVFDPNVWRDGWCMNPYINVKALQTTFFGDSYSSYEPALLISGPAGIGDLTYLGGINWLLNQDYTATNSGYSYGEIQLAIWTLLGFALNPNRHLASDVSAHDPALGATPPNTKDGVVSTADVTTLVNAAISNNNFVPDNTEYIGLVIYPYALGDLLYQPMITPVRAAMLGDYVWHDVNANGLQDDGATGIGGATVKLVRDLNGDNDFDDPGEVLATTTTDVTGYYEFKGLMPGLDYTVIFEKPAGYDGVSPYQVGGAGAGDNSDGLQSSTITLAEGEFNRTIDSGFYKFASLGDRLWVDSNGNGLQDDGATGISGRTVSLIGGGTDGLISTAGDNTTATTTTGADGIYSFTGLTPGVEYQVQFADIPAGTVFTTPNVSANGFDTTDSDANPADGKTPIVTLGSGENNTTLDAGVYTPATLSGYVYQDAGNDGVRNAEPPIFDVVLTLSGTDGAGNAVTGSATTDSNGYYQFADLPPGTYTVSEAQPAGYQDGKDTAGTPGGGSAGNDVISNITLTSGMNSTENNFGELPLVSSKGLVAPTGTTAEQYIRGTAPTFEDYYALATGGDFQYTTDEGLIAQTNPGVMFYFTGRSGALMADSSGNLGIDIVQDNNNSSFPLFDIKDNNVKLYAVNVGADGLIGTADDSLAQSGLGTITRTDSSDPGAEVDQAHIAISGAAAGQQFVVSVKYDPELAGTNAGALGNPSVHYNFSTKANGALVEEDNPDSFGIPGVDLVYKFAASPVASVVATASLGNLVWCDTKGNGVQDAGEAGIAGVTVNLLDSAAAVLSTTTTDSAGQYLFAELQAGNYQVQVVKPAAFAGFTSANQGNNDALDSDVNSLGVSSLISLAAGQNDSSVDAGLRPPAGNSVTPIAIDLDGDGLETLALAASTGRFDLLGNGSKVKSGWLAKDDGFLAIDTNHNGRIDHINELFGGNKQGEGFAELIAFDSNGDLVVDARDARFVDLSVWRDANGNHRTDAGELMSLAQAGVVSLSVDYAADSAFWDVQGNLHSEQSSATLASGQVVDMTDINFMVAANDLPSSTALSPLSAGLMFA